MTDGEVPAAGVVLVDDTGCEDSDSIVASVCTEQRWLRPGMPVRELVTRTRDRTPATTASPTAATTSAASPAS
ncbi:hypothetical protein KHQ06_26945 [Nocardia tengchongensis]|uniref:Uncharacterized protein n=1 Tax=Nocardia tengchongensis TaxID=2055889 RepID=A0ABX8CIV9_9NOCA|nr:hypothetical protein [Nocardia tengchongensis]QVI19912.1 hypothetical protein KHQ06_26945 [Nocardia tengchongensis]